MERSRDLDDARYAAVRQYARSDPWRLGGGSHPDGSACLGLCSPAQGPAWGDEPLAQSLLILLTLGLIWQFVLVLILVKRELGTLEWSRVRDALWLRSPRDPKSGRVGGRVWWWLIPFLLIFGLEQLLPAIPGPSVRDFGDFLGTDRAEDFFHGAWGWYAVIVVLSIFNTVLGEELLFRGLLLPRMQGVFGRRDWVANGVLFALYHLHQPWSIPNTFVDGPFLLAYPSRRFQSAWVGIIAHSVQSPFFIIIVLTKVLD